MAVIINATTTTGLTTSADNSGVIQFQSNGANTVGISSTGYLTIGGNQQIYGPAFSAYPASNQNISNNTWTKINVDTKTFDTNTNFNTSLYRFLPTVAGYYQINGTVQLNTSTNPVGAAIYKNGGEVTYSLGAFQSGALNSQACVAALVYLNGSTDYVELFGYQSTGGTIASTASRCQFSGSMVRGA